MASLAYTVPILGCGALLVAMVLQILAFASPYWVEDEWGDFGLWRIAKCKDWERGEEGCWKHNHYFDVDTWLDIVRALECLALIFWSLPLVVVPVYMYVSQGLYYRRTMVVMAVLTVLGALTSGGGVLIALYEVLVEDDYSLGWCIFVCAVGAGCGLLAFLAFLTATFNRPAFPSHDWIISGFYADPDKNRLYVIDGLDPIIRSSMSNIADNKSLPF